MKEKMEEKNTAPEEKKDSGEHQKEELPGVPQGDAEKKIAGLEEQLSAWNDKYLRLYSEFDNFRKRTAKERVEILSMASAEIIKNLLPVLDDLERALRNNEKVSDAAAVKEGVKLITQKFRSVLAQKGLEPIHAVGEKFDVDLHEAITNLPAPDEKQKGKVLEEVEKGYTLNGKVIRFSKVIVGS